MKSTSAIRLPGNRNGFTLIELLCVMVIMAILTSLLMPEIESIRKKAQSVSCFGNLRQIGVAVSLYIAEHDNTYPCIETNPADPIVYADQPDVQARSMLVTLQPYGVTDKMLQCPNDIAGPNYYKQMGGTSYEWRPMLDGENKVNPTVISRRGALRVALPSTIRQVTDFSAVHNGRMNALYGDGHVSMY